MKVVTNLDKKITDDNIVNYKRKKETSKIIDELEKENNELAQQMPWKTTEISDSIHVEDSAKYSRNRLNIFGNLTQKKRNGYNCIDLREFETQTKNGVTVTNDDGRLVFNGTTTQAVGFYINVTEKTIKAGTYTKSVEENNDIGSKMTVSLRLQQYRNKYYNITTVVN